MNTDSERQAEPASDGATWWCKLLARGVGVIAAIIVGICGILSFLSILHPICIVSGVIMLFIAAILIILEAPICCAFFDSTRSISDWMSRRKFWHKGLFYVLISILPVAICFGVTTFIGCVPPFATGVIYGLMALGKKADRSEMISNARSGSQPKFEKFENETG